MPWSGFPLARRSWDVFRKGRRVTHGDSRALFVVQRHFRVVRRVYDPDEVDRHLHLVAELFSKSGARRHIGEVEATLREREARLEDHERLVRTLRDSRGN